MFRSMRRFNQQLSNEESVNILLNGKTGILGVIGEMGYPYTVPLNYAYSNKKIYFHTAKEGHKIDAIKQCDKVSFCVIDKDDVVSEKLTSYYRSVIVFGKANILESKEDIFHAAKLIGMKYSDDKEKISNEIKKFENVLCCVEITIENITGKEAVELRKNKKQHN